MVERRVLGTEKIMLLDGTEKEINVYGVGYAEKWRLVNGNTTTKLEKGYQYKIVDEVKVRDEILRIALSDVDFESLDYNTDLLYAKYFSVSEAKEKKDETSTTGQTVTE